MSATIRFRQERGERIYSLAAFGVLCLSVTGLFLSLVIHVVTLAGFFWHVLGQAPLILLLCVFVTNPPAGLLVRRMCMGVPLRHTLRAMFAGCPRWMCWAGPVLFYYGVINAAVLAWIDSQAGALVQFNQGLSLVGARGMSAFCISFYSASTVFAFSAWNFNRRGGRRCPNQHAVATTATFCGQCGAKIGDETWATPTEEPA